MNRRLVRSLVILVAFFITAGALTLVQAQTPAPAANNTVKVVYDFVAAGKTYNRGTYTVDIAASGNVVMTPDNGGKVIELTPIKKFTRNTSRVELVFDLAGSGYFLAEVWVPGKGGAKVGSQPESAERETVKGPKAAK